MISHSTTSHWPLKRLQFWNKLMIHNNGTTKTNDKFNWVSSVCVNRRMTTNIWWDCRIAVYRLSHPPCCAAHTAQAIYIEFIIFQFNYGSGICLNVASQRQMLHTLVQRAYIYFLLFLARVPSPWQHLTTYFYFVMNYTFELFCILIWCRLFSICCCCIYSVHCTDTILSKDDGGVSPIFPLHYEVFSYLIEQIKHIWNWMVSDWRGLKSD